MVQIEVEGTKVVWGGLVDWDIEEAIISSNRWVGELQFSSLCLCSFKDLASQFLHSIEQYSFFAVEWEFTNEAPNFACDNWPFTVFLRSRHPNGLQTLTTAKAVWIGRRGYLVIRGNCMDVWDVESCYMGGSWGLVWGSLAPEGVLSPGGAFYWMRVVEVLQILSPQKLGTPGVDACASPYEVLYLHIIKNYDGPTISIDEARDQVEDAHDEVPLAQLPAAWESSIPPLAQSIRRVKQWRLPNTIQRKENLLKLLR